MSSSRGSSPQRPSSTFRRSAPRSSFRSQSTNSVLGNSKRPASRPTSRPRTQRPSRPVSKPRASKKPLRVITDSNPKTWGDVDSMTERVKSGAQGPAKEEDGEEDEESTNIRVVIRCRQPDEADCDKGIIVHRVDDTTVGVDSYPNNFNFDTVFPLDVSQLEVFETIGVDLVAAAFDGYNAQIFAYGQTSTGKSYSMMGIPGTDHVGLIPRVAHLLFNTINSAPERRIIVETIYLEIYNEKLRDLLNANSKDNLPMRESKTLGTHVVGLKSRKVSCPEEVDDVISTALQNRTTAATLYNVESSRSHAVFELRIQQKYKDPTSGEEMQCVSRIGMIDLAGSERSEKVMSVGKTLQEGNNINKSLTVLGRCIRALVENSQGKRVMVPFRDSLLTRYLKEALAGNARTTMLATISPVLQNKEETISTLRYAASVKNLKTSAKKNEDPAQAKIRELSEQIMKLKSQLKQAQSVDTPPFTPSYGMMSGSQDLESPRLQPEEGGRTVNFMLSANTERRITEGSERSDDSTIQPYGFDSFRSTESPSSARSLSSKFSSKSFELDGKNMRKSEKRELLRELMRQAALLQEAELDEEDLDEPITPSKPAVQFPQLSCLNQDSMLSHVMTINLHGKRMFTIGRSSGSYKDFTLDGMGMQAEHCRILFPDEGEEGEPTIQSLCVGAVVHVNGNPLEEGGTAVPLQHMDRIVFGPCRLICLYLTKPLAVDERLQWTYDAAFDELVHSSEHMQLKLMGTERRRLVNDLNLTKSVLLEQANIMAVEMCACVRFQVKLVMGDYGVDRSEVSVDDIFDKNSARVVVSCVCTDKQISSAAQAHRVHKRHQANEATNRRRVSHGGGDPMRGVTRRYSDAGMASGTASDVSSSFKAEKAVSAAPATPLRRGVSRRVSLNDAPIAADQEDSPAPLIRKHPTRDLTRNDRLSMQAEMEGSDRNARDLTLSVSTSRSTDEEKQQHGRLDSVELLSAELEKDGVVFTKMNSTMSEVQHSEPSDEVMSLSDPDASKNTSAIMATGGVNHTLFDVPLHEFQDLLVELKATHSSLVGLMATIVDSSSSQQLEKKPTFGEYFMNLFTTSGSQEQEAPTNATSLSRAKSLGAKESMVSLFQSLDYRKSGRIDRSQLASFVRRFDPNDKDFLEIVWPESEDGQADQLDFDAFERFLVQFLQYQFYRKLEPYVTNKHLFIEIGGLDEIQKYKHILAKHKKAEKAAGLKLETAEAATRRVQRKIKALEAKMKDLEHRDGQRKQQNQEYAKTVKEQEQEIARLATSLREASADLHKGPEDEVPIPDDTPDNDPSQALDDEVSQPRSSTTTRRLSTPSVRKSDDSVELEDHASIDRRSRSSDEHVKHETPTASTSAMLFELGMEAKVDGFRKLDLKNASEILRAKESDLESIGMSPNEIRRIVMRAKREKEYARLSSSLKSKMEELQDVSRDHRVIEAKWMEETHRLRALVQDSEAVKFEAEARLESAEELCGELYDEITVLRKREEKRLIAEKEKPKRKSSWIFGRRPSQSNNSSPTHSNQSQQLQPASSSHSLLHTQSTQSLPRANSRRSIRSMSTDSVTASPAHRPSTSSRFDRHSTYTLDTALDDDDEFGHLPIVLLDLGLEDHWEVFHKHGIASANDLLRYSAKDLQRMGLSADEARRLLNRVNKDADAEALVKALNTATDQINSLREKYEKAQRTWEGQVRTLKLELDAKNRELKRHHQRRISGAPSQHTLHLSTGHQSLPAHSRGGSSGGSGSLPRSSNSISPLRSSSRRESHHHSRPSPTQRLRSSTVDEEALGLPPPAFQPEEDGTHGSTVVRSVSAGQTAFRHSRGAPPVSPHSPDDPPPAHQQQPRSVGRVQQPRRRPARQSRDTVVQSNSASSPKH